MGVKKTPDSLFSDDNNIKHLPNELIVLSALEYIGHLAAILDFSEDAIISTSLDGIIKSWNKGSENIFGYTSNEMIDKNISLIIPPGFVNEEENILKRI